MDIAPEEGGYSLPKEMDFSPECEELLNGDYFFYEVVVPTLKISKNGLPVGEILADIAYFKDVVDQILDFMDPMAFYGYKMDDYGSEVDYLFKVLDYMKEQLNNL